MELVAPAAVRLHPARLQALAPGVARPAYDRGALRAGIVHLGLGAFARGHLAAVNEAALHASGDLRWGICGVSLRQAGTRDALAPQGGLYTLVLRSADAEGQTCEQLAVIGCLLETLAAPENPRAVLARIASADTRIVSLTVTEKGYCHDPASGALSLAHPDIAHDLGQPLAPRSSIGFLVWGLQRRRAAGLGPVTLLSLDNLPDNGHLLRGLVLTFAAQVDARLAEWIGQTCSFPCSMVDRIVPRTTGADRVAVTRALGLEDAWPVQAEPYLEWVVEDTFAAGRPDWAVGGARFVAEAAPFEMLKLRMVNGTHSALAYLSVMAGWETVDQAVAQPMLRRYLATLMRAEIAPTLPALPGLDLAAYQERLLQRYANPALRHQTRQIAMDGSQKMPQRLLGTVRARLAADQSITGLALALAGWLRFLHAVDQAGRRYPIEDPLAEVLARQLAQADQAARQAPPGPAAALAWTREMTALVTVFGDLGNDARFVREVARAAGSLRALGVAGALAAMGEGPA